MNPDLAVVLGLLALAILMFAFNRPRADAVALIAMAVLPFTGTVTATEAIAGFSNPNVVLIAAMFVIGEALARTGVAQRIGDWLARTGGSSPWRLLVLLMLAVGLLSGVLNGSTSFSGPPVILFLVNQETSRETFRGSLSIYFLCLNLVAVPALIVGGLYSMEAARMTLMGAPLVLAGGLLGTWLSRRVGDREFRKASLGFLALLGFVSLLLAIADAT